MTSERRASYSLESPRTLAGVRRGQHPTPWKARDASLRYLSPVSRPARRISVDSDRALHVADVLKAVAHPLRLRIVASLCEREENVGDLAEKLGASQAIVSQQLRILRSHGLVAANREGGFARYRLVEQNLRGLVRCMENCDR
jgi:ArsR family transcriptional regulator